MSRSRKRFPIHGNTCASSDRYWKTQNHHADRRKGREALAGGAEPGPDMSDEWKSQKDGRSYGKYPGWERK